MPTAALRPPGLIAQARRGCSASGRARLYAANDVAMLPQRHLVTVEADSRTGKDDRLVFEGNPPCAPSMTFGPRAAKVCDAAGHVSLVVRSGNRLPCCGAPCISAQINDW
jgi:hypothetical protein